MMEVEATSPEAPGLCGQPQPAISLRRDPTGKPMDTAGTDADHGSGDDV